MPVRDTICYVYQTPICILRMLSNLPASLAFCTTIKVLSLRQVSDVFVFAHDYYDISERKKSS